MLRRSVTSVGGRVLRGFGANTYAQIVTAVMQLVSVPVLLHAWGPQQYGEWLILFAIPAYLSMGDLGFSQSAANDMTARVARGDGAGAVRVFKSLVVLVCGIAVTGAIFVALVVPLLPLVDWLHLREMDDATAQSILGLFSAAVLAALPDGVSHAGFRASGDYALHVFLSATARLFQFSAVWITAGVGGGPVAAAFLFCLVRVVMTLGIAALMLRREAWLRLGWRTSTRASLSSLLPAALANLATPLAQVLSLQGMVIVVGSVLGPLSVVVFSTLRTLTRLSLQLVLAVAHSIEPELASAYGADNRALMKTLFLHALRSGFWLALAAVIGLAAFGGTILEKWTNGAVQVHPWLFGWLLASAVASVFWYDALIALKAANRHLRVAVTYALASALALGAAAVVLQWTGDLGAAGFCLLLLDVITACFTMTAAGRLLGISTARLLAGAMDPFPLLHLIHKKAFVR
jgi:O-antigen/teichoic acid export membrane protein